MIIDRGMIARFMLTVIVVGLAGYWVMYSVWPQGPFALRDTEPDHDSISVIGEPNMDLTSPDPGYEPPLRDYFVEHRMERERERSERVELLREIVNNQNSTAETRSTAQMDIIEMIGIREKEMLVERLIVGKGFDDAVVFFGSEVVEVIVRSDALTESEALVIADVVCSVGGVDLRNVRVRFRK